MIVGVESRLRGHGENFAGARTHENRGDHVRVESLVSVGQFALDDGLQTHVDRQLHGHAVAGRTFDAAVGHDLAAGAVALGVDKAVLPAQVGLHHHFHALDTAALVVEEADNVAEHVLVRVVPLRLAFEQQAAQFLRGQFLLDRGHLDGTDLALQDDVGLFRIDALGHLLDRQTEVARENFRRARTVGQQRPVGHHRVDRHVVGENLPADVGDLASLGRHDLFAGRGVGHGALELLVLADLQVDQPPGVNAEHEREGDADQTGSLVDTAAHGSASPSGATATTGCAARAVV